jgi:hypothetical protein
MVGPLLICGPGKGDPSLNGPDGQGLREKKGYTEAYKAISIWATEVVADLAEESEEEDDNDDNPCVMLRKSVEEAWTENQDRPLQDEPKEDFFLWAIARIPFPLGFNPSVEYVFY